MLTHLLAWAIVAPGLVAHGSYVRKDACTLEELYEPWVSPATQIASAKDANFSTVVGRRWSLWEVPQWSGAIKPATEADLQKVVQVSVANNVPFIATNGGHGPKRGQGSFTGVNVNLASFNSVSIDTTNNLVTIGAGVKLWDIQSALYAVGKEIQTGNAMCPGAIGVTVGGGIGMMTGMHGLIIDTLKSVRMITAKGDIVKASSTENKDLFWALRGAGSNFGIITEATYGIHEQTNGGNLTEVTLVYPPAANRSVWETIRTFDGNQPAKLSFQAVIEFDRTSNSPTLVVQLWYYGNATEAQPYIDQFAAAGPVVKVVANKRQTDVYFESATGPCVTGNIVSAHTLGFKQTDVATYEAHFADMIAFYHANPAFNGYSVFQYYSNKVTQQTPASETVFPWRDVQAWWLTQNIYTDVSIGPTVDSFMGQQRKNFQATSGFSTPHVYLNYASGDEGSAAWFSEANLPKLRKLKNIWDPNYVFGNGVPLYSTSSI